MHIIIIIIIIDANKVMNPRHFGSQYGLMGKSGFESRIIFG